MRKTVNLLTPKSPESPVFAVLSGYLCERFFFGMFQKNDLSGLVLLELSFGGRIPKF